MGFLIAAICVGVLSIIFAIQGDFKAFGGGMVIAACLVVCWIFRKKKQRQSGKPQPANTSTTAHTYSPTPSIPQPAPTAEVPEPKGGPADAVAEPHEQHKSENHHVTGTSHYQRELESLGEENPVYEYSKKELIDEGYEDEKVYYYDFSPTTVELVEELDNAYDPNAIKVVVDGVHIGYIKKGSCAHVKKLLHSGAITKISAEIRGGKYKFLYCEYDDEKEKDVYQLECGTLDYYATVIIQYIDQ